MFINQQFKKLYFFHLVWPNDLFIFQIWTCMRLIMSKCSGTYYCGARQSEIILRAVEWTTKMADDAKTGVGGIRDPEVFLLSNLLSHSMEDEWNLSMWVSALELVLTVMITTRFCSKRTEICFSLHLTFECILWCCILCLSKLEFQN